MLYKIIDRIKAYCTSVSKPVNVVEFGVDKLPAPPYVVVKQEQGINGTDFRIISHFKPGQQKFLRAFNRTTIGQALDDFKATSETGVYNILYSNALGVGGNIITNSDGTISLERVYNMPDRLY